VGSTGPKKPRTQDAKAYIYDIRIYIYDGHRAPLSTNTTTLSTGMKPPPRAGAPVEVVRGTFQRCSEGFGFGFVAMCKDAERGLALLLGGIRWVGDAQGSRGESPGLWRGDVASAGKEGLWAGLLPACV